MSEQKHWWIDYPWRMVQTNLREIDMAHMDAKAYARELQEYHATAVTLNAAGMIASYESTLPYQPVSTYLTGDSLKKMIDACHAVGIKVIARCDFSKIRYEIFEKHPEWAYRDADGSIMNYNGFVQTCTNSEYQTEKAAEVLEELFREHDFDGVFFNMSGFMVVDYDLKVYGPCHCENCLRLYREKFKTEPPRTLDRKDPSLGRYIAFMSACSAKHKQALYRRIKSINPTIAVSGFDYKRVESNQDISRPAWVYDSSCHVRKTRMAAETMVCDSASASYLGFPYRHVAISPGLEALRQWQNLANGAGTSIYVLGTLGGLADRSAAKAAGEVFTFHAAHEAVYAGLHSAAKVLLVEKQGMGSTDPEAAGWIRALTECHIPFDQAGLSELAALLPGRYRTVILADAAQLSDEAAVLLDDFAAQGGCLLATGNSGWSLANGRPRPANVLKSLGLSPESEKRTGQKSSVFAIAADEPFESCLRDGITWLAAGDELRVVEAADRSITDTFLNLIPEQPYGPPEIAYPTAFCRAPGLLVTAYGKGKGVYLPWLPGRFYHREGWHNTLAFMKDVLTVFCGAESVAPLLTPMCEVTVRANAERMLIQLVNTSGCFDHCFFEPIPICDIELDGSAAIGMEAGNYEKDNMEADGRAAQKNPSCSARPGKIREVRTLNGGKVSLCEKDGRQIIRLNRLAAYEAIEVLYQPE